jgi:hypothetical protein
MMARNADLDEARERNLIMHAYDEELADQIYVRLLQHAALMTVRIEAMEREIVSR